MISRYHNFKIACIRKCLVCVAKSGCVRIAFPNDSFGSPFQLPSICFICRNYYTNAATPPKDIVVLIDTSSRMVDKLPDAKAIANLILQTANRNDQVL